MLGSIWNTLEKIVTGILCPNPKNRLPYSETQGEKITFNGVEYIRCYYACEGWAGQGDYPRHRWGWLTKEECMDNTKRAGVAVVKEPCPRVENCWGKGNE